MKRPRVLLADDDRLLRDALSQLLDRSCDVVGAEPDGRALLAAAAELRPDVVVLDAALPLLNGLDAARRLRRDLPQVKVIVLARREDADLAAEAFRIGASGYVLKKSGASELVQAIHEVFQGRAYVSPLAMQGMVDRLIRAPEPARGAGVLSPRRREVLRLLAEGRSMKETARILNITPRTVAFHKYGMMGEHGIKSNAELVHFAVKRRLVSI
jgi:DNA-binding NarL/FixJ family response regulator